MDDGQRFCSCGLHLNSHARLHLGTIQPPKLPICKLCLTIGICGAACATMWTTSRSPPLWWHRRTLGDDCATPICLPATECARPFQTSRWAVCLCFGDSLGLVPDGPAFLGIVGPCHSPSNFCLLQLLHRRQYLVHIDHLRVIPLSC